MYVCLCLLLLGLASTSQDEAASTRGWRNTVGNLIEISWPKINNKRHHVTGICVKDRGVQFHRIRDLKQYYFNSIPPTSHVSRGTPNESTAPQNDGSCSLDNSARSSRFAVRGGNNIQGGRGSADRPTETFENSRRAAVGETLRTRPTSMNSKPIICIPNMKNI